LLLYRRTDSCPVRFLRHTRPVPRYATLLPTVRFKSKFLLHTQQHFHVLMLLILTRQATQHVDTLPLQSPFWAVTVCSAIFFFDGSIDSTGPWPDIAASSILPYMGYHVVSFWAIRFLQLYPSEHESFYGMGSLAP
jgi:hypothetical protein